MSQVARQTMLEYYRAHQIAPVSYDLSSMNAHMERRFSLYTKLGITPLTFRDANVLEVAAGTGHNSLYVAGCMPSRLVLLEPNQAGVKHIHEVYAQFEGKHTRPDIICQTLEEYTPKEQFDIVLCENWLGTSAHEQLLLQKLSSMVSQHGLLVLTTVSPVGMAPNLLRRFLSIYLADLDYDFKRRTEILVSAFGSHLSTLAAMTRSKIDWVQDNMMHPAYFSLCLTMPNLVACLGDRFDVLGSSPHFAEDWRWFKGMYGSDRKFNETFLAEYWKKSHNFLDYHEQAFEGDTEANIQLEKHAFNLLRAIAGHEDAHIKKIDTRAALQSVLDALDQFMTFVPGKFNAVLNGLNEVRDLIRNPSAISVDSVSNMKNFARLFGREGTYLSMMRVST